MRNHNEHFQHAPVVVHQNGNGKYGWQKWVFGVLASGILGTSALAYVFDFFTAPAKLRDVAAKVESVDAKFSQTLKEHSDQLLLLNQIVMDIQKSQKEQTKQFSEMNYNIGRIAQELDDKTVHTKSYETPRKQEAEGDEPK